MSFRDIDIKGQKIFPPLLGGFVFLMMSFDKGFSYIHFWIGKIPLFITEIFLLILMLFALIRVIVEKPKFIFEDRYFLIGIGCFWISGAYAFIQAILTDPTSLNAFKRLALWYYSLFCVFMTILMRKRTDLEKVLLFMFAGGILALFFDLFWKTIIEQPTWWPINVGYARANALIFVGLYSIYMNKTKNRVISIIGALSFLIVLFSSIRTALVSIGLLVMLVGFQMALKGYSYEIKNNFKQFGKYTLILLPFCFLTWGIPHSMQRLARIIGIDLNIKNLSGFIKRVEPIPDDAKYQVEEIVEEIDERQVRVPKEKITQVKPDQTIVIPPSLPEKEFIPDKKGNLYELLNKPYQKILEKEGNSAWRLRVWRSAVLSLLRSNWFTGMGVVNPLIVPEVSPYLTDERMQKAMELLRVRHDFYNRMTDEDRDPSQNISSDPPLQLEQDEYDRSYSLYWYDIDPHNSHIAILYRFGILGFMGYALIIILTLRRLWEKTNLNDGVASLLLTFLFVQIISSSLCVALEGPFMGSIFWITLGLSFFVANSNVKQDFQ